MVCRGDRPRTIDFHGLTAAYELPQRVVGYRPTSRFFPEGYRVAVHLAGCPLPKIAKSGATDLSLLAHATLGGLALRG